MPYDGVLRVSSSRRQQGRANVNRSQKLIKLHALHLSASSPMPVEHPISVDLVTGGTGPIGYAIEYVAETEPTGLRLETREGAMRHTDGWVFEEPPFPTGADCVGDGVGGPSRFWTGGSTYTCSARAARACKYCQMGVRRCAVPFLLKEKFALCCRGGTRRLYSRARARSVPLLRAGASSDEGGGEGRELKLGSMSGRFRRIR